MMQQQILKSQPNNLPYSKLSEQDQLNTRLRSQCKQYEDEIKNLKESHALLLMKERLNSSTPQNLAQNPNQLGAPFHCCSNTQNKNANNDNFEQIKTEIESLSNKINNMVDKTNPQFSTVVSEIQNQNANLKQKIKHMENIISNIAHILQLMLPVMSKN